MPSRRPYTEEELSNIGLRIRILRGPRSQAEFAKAVGVSAGALSHYEVGRRLPSGEVLDRIAAVARTSKEWLLTGRMPLEEQPAWPGVQLGGGQVVAFVAAFTELTPEFKMAMLSLMIAGLRLSEERHMPPGAFEHLRNELEQILSECQQRALEGPPKIDDSV